MPTLGRGGANIRAVPDPTGTASDPANLDPDFSAVEPATLQLYYAHQYERYEQHEQQRLTLSNIVIASSVVALAIAFRTADQPVRPSTASGIAFLVAGGNLAAIGFIVRTGEILEAHRTRARTVLAALSPELGQYNSDLRWTTRKGIHSRAGYLIVLHVLFVAVCALAFIDQIQQPSSSGDAPPTSAVPTD